MNKPTIHKYNKLSFNLKKKVLFVWRIIIYLFDVLLDVLLEHARVIRREWGLFLGSALFTIGLFGFESDKYCDGNTADYLSCTRPTTYYYYDAVGIILLVLGVFFILIWLLKNREGKIKE